MPEFSGYPVISPLTYLALVLYTYYIWMGYQVSPSPINIGSISSKTPRRFAGGLVYCIKRPLYEQISKMPEFWQFSSIMTHKWREIGEYAPKIA